MKSTRGQRSRFGHALHARFRVRSLEQSISRTTWFLITNVVVLSSKILSPLAAQACQLSQTCETQDFGAILKISQEFFHIIRKISQVICRPDSYYIVVSLKILHLTSDLNCFSDSHYNFCLFTPIYNMAIKFSTR